MATLKTQAIVLRHTNYREHDRMLTLFSPELGRLEAGARGCMKPKSPLIAASELFSVGEYVLYQKAGRFTVTGFALEESYYPLRLDYDRLRYAMFLLSLTEAVVMPGEGNEPLFVLLRKALAYLTYGQECLPEAVAAGFLMGFAETLGYRPVLGACVRCGSTAASTWRLDDLAGGLVCARCESAGEKTSREVLALLQRLQAEGLPYAEGLRERTPELVTALRWLRRFVEGRMEKRIRSAKLL